MLTELTRSGGACMHFSRHAREMHREERRDPQREKLSRHGRSMHLLRFVERRAGTP